MKKKAKKFRPQYPGAQELHDLLARFRANSYTDADLIRAVDLLAKAGIRCSEGEVQALKSAQR